MDGKTTIPCNKLMQLENSMLIYGIYNEEMLGKLINTVHNIRNTTSSHEIICRTAKLSDTQITLCKLIGFTSLFHQLTAIYKNSSR